MFFSLPPRLVKVCDKQHVLRERKIDYIKRERNSMHALSGVPGFVSLYCTFQSYDSLFFVMTYAANGDLLPHITKVGSFTIECTQFYAAELVVALENMHRRGVIHRDLKPENILLDENMHTLIGDFGSAKVFNPQNSAGIVSASPPTSATLPTADTADASMQRRRANSFVGTAQYVSPEVLTGVQTSVAADLWALGCIIYQMISGLPPFRGVTEYLIFQKILKLDMTFPDGFDPNAKDLVMKLLQIDPTDRLGATDSNFTYSSIREHPFFDGIEWQTLRTQTPPRIYPYLPGVCDDNVVPYRVPQHLEPGLGADQLQRLLGLELGTAQPEMEAHEHVEDEEPRS